MPMNNAKYPVMALALLVLSAGPLRAQDAQELLQSYRRNFAIASLEVKIQIVQDAGKTGNREMGPLYLEAVDFVLENYSFLDTDQRFRALGVAATEQIRAIGFAEARYSIWKLFQTDTFQDLRLSCLNALAVVGKGDPEIVQNLNLWLAAQNTVFQTGQIPDVPVILAAVKALGALGDGSSFPVLFSTMNVGYPADVSRIAREALLAIPGNQKDLFVGVLQASSLPEKRLALEMALESNRLSDSDKGEVAEFAMDVGLHTGTTDNQLKASAREIRFMAARALSARKWSKATPLAIEHFNTLLIEYERGLADRRFLVEAVDCLGNMGTHAAAVRLTQYLILLNSYTEKIREFDGVIVLAVIQNLGKLGDKVAFDDLMYVEYLSYSSEIKAAARKVRSSLAW
jgi:HEAT repeat protein